MKWRRIKRFYKPNIMTVSLALLCLGLTLKFLVPVFAMVDIIPCKVYLGEESSIGLCPLNPDPETSTHYLFFALGDHLYMAIYLIILILVIPYTLSCSIFHVYYQYIKKIVSR